MSPADVAILFLLGLVAFWLLGGFVARVSGLVLVFAGAANLALSPQMGAVMLVGIGAAMWLLGHWHYALRHQAYKSPLARHVFCRWAPEWLDPTRNWVIPTGARQTLLGEVGGENSRRSFDSRSDSGR
jgi:hypothetical protein